MTNRQLTILAILFLVVFIVCSVAALFAYRLVAPMPTPSATSIPTTPTRTPRPTPIIRTLTHTPRPKPTPKPLEFEGRGDSVEAFTVTNIDAIIVMSYHLGDGNFIIQVLNKYGDLIGLGANCIGHCDSERVVQLVGDGDYLLQVTADGRWRVLIIPVE